MELKLTEDQIYAITAKSMSYAQRLFIDGVEYPAIGKTADNAEEVEPESTRYVQTFQPTGETTEIILHHSNFVYGDSGGLYPMELGLAEQIVHSQQLRVIWAVTVAAALLMAMLLFGGLFCSSRNTGSCSGLPSPAVVSDCGGCSWAIKLLWFCCRNLTGI